MAALAVPDPLDVTPEKRPCRRLYVSPDAANALSIVWMLAVPEYASVVISLASARLPSVAMALLSGRHRVPFHRGPRPPGCAQQRVDHGRAVPCRHPIAAPATRNPAVGDLPARRSFD